MVMVKFWKPDKPRPHVSEEYGPFDGIRVGDDMMLGYWGDDEVWSVIHTALGWEAPDGKYYRDASVWSLGT